MPLVISELNYCPLPFLICTKVVLSSTLYSSLSTQSYDKVISVDAFPKL